jgi:thiol-disulfide isomerase/thioredoxin
VKHVTFYSTTFCPTCKFLKPKVQEAYPDTEFVLLDETSGLTIADNLGIYSVPTIIFWDGDTELTRLTGGITMKQFYDTLNEAIL